MLWTRALASVLCCLLEAELDAPIAVAGEGSPRGNEATASAPPTGDSSIPRSGSADVTRGQRSASTRPTNWSRAAPPSADDLVRKAVLTAAENATYETPLLRLCWCCVSAV